MNMRPMRRAAPVLVPFDVKATQHLWTPSHPGGVPLSRHQRGAVAAPVLAVPRATFATGGAHEDVWVGEPWTEMTRVTGRASHATRFKALWSDEGVHFLVECEDRRVTARPRRDGEDLWTEDVVEIFLRPERRRGAYFQYALSPLGAELALMIPNASQPMGWAPWKYEGVRRVRKEIRFAGGDGQPGARIERWSAEICVPFALLVGLIDGRPGHGTRWDANVFRRDYDETPPTMWAWSTAAGTETHAVAAYGTLVFDANVRR